MTAFDIEEWAVANSRENVEMNDCRRIDVQMGTIRDTPADLKVGLILANIHKNVLIDEMSEYVCRLQSGGILVMSGFYEENIAEIDEKAASMGLHPNHSEGLNKWCCSSYIL